MNKLNNIINDDLNNYLETFTFLKKSISNNLVYQILNRCQLLSLLDNIRIKLFTEGDTFLLDLDIESIHNLGELVDELNDDDCISIKLSSEKTSTDTLMIFDMDSFITDINFEEKRKLWECVFKKFNAISFLNDANEIQKLEFTKSPSNKVSSSNKFNQLNDIPRFYYDKSLEIQNTIFSNELKIISSFCFLMNTSSTYDFEENLSFEFEGFRNFIIPNVNSDELLKINITLINIHDWLTSDKHVSSKLGILRNLLSLSKSTKISVCFNQELVNALYSNFTIYLQDNINQYFEIKNKVSEFIYDLSNKGADTLEQYSKNAQHILLAILSYFFTVIVFTTIDKNNTINNMFTPALGTLSSCFVVVSIFLLCESRNTLAQKAIDIQDQMLEIKGRYRLILSEQELDGLFDSPSLKTAISRISNSKIHNVYIGILVCVLSVLWLIIVSI
jgi:hypothetical protein